MSTLVVWVLVLPVRFQERAKSHQACIHIIGKTVSVMKSNLNFYFVFFALLGLMLLFNPDTNANNLVYFGLIKSMLFLITCTVFLIQMILPLKLECWKAQRGQLFYYFLLLVFVPTSLLYILATLKHILTLFG